MTRLERPYVAHHSAKTIQHCGNLRVDGDVRADGVNRERCAINDREGAVVLDVLHSVAQRLHGGAVVNGVHDALHAAHYMSRRAIDYRRRTSRTSCRCACASACRRACASSPCPPLCSSSSSSRRSPTSLTSLTWTPPTGCPS